MPEYLVSIPTNNWEHIAVTANNSDDAKQYVANGGGTSLEKEDNGYSTDLDEWKVRILVRGAVR